MGCINAEVRRIGGSLNTEISTYKGLEVSISAEIGLSTQISNLNPPLIVSCSLICTILDIWDSLYDADDILLLDCNGIELRAKMEDYGYKT